LGGVVDVEQIGKAADKGGGGEFLKSSQDIKSRELIRGQGEATK